jgi:hypothetical protein
MREKSGSLIPLILAFSPSGGEGNEDDSFSLSRVKGGMREMI